VRNSLPLLVFVKERFPLPILTFTSLSSILASAIVTAESYSAGQVVVAFVIITFFLFHIRAIDERRDFVNDSTLHPERPVQLGTVSVKTLLTISVAGILFSLVLAFFSSKPSFVIALLFVAYTSLAAFDFFVPSLFINKPVLYHIINSPQMILAQWLIFSIFSDSFLINGDMLLFMLLIYNNIFILELVRKVKDPANDSADSYTAQLGLKKSVAFLILLVLSGFVIYCFLIKSMGVCQIADYLWGSLLCTWVIGVILIFYYKPTQFFQQMMELSTVIFYVILNILIFLAG
jgi:hypothetical protein